MCGLWRPDEAQRNLLCVSQLWSNQRMLVNFWVASDPDKITAGSGAPPPEENSTERKYTSYLLAAGHEPGYWPVFSLLSSIENNEIRLASEVSRTTGTIPYQRRSTNQSAAAPEPITSFSSFFDSSPGAGAYANAFRLGSSASPPPVASSLLPLSSLIPHLALA